MSKVLRAKIGAHVATLMSTSVHCSHWNMTGALPATIAIAVQTVILISHSVDYSYRNTTTVLPATFGAQLAFQTEMWATYYRSQLELR